MTPERFAIDMPQAALTDLRDRLARTRLPDDWANEDWRYGVPRNWLAPLLDHWRDRFDWRAQEAAMNRFAHYRVTIDDGPVHFLHAPGKGPRPIPLILTHGWPWTFWDWRDVIGPLSDPGAHGGDPADAFDVIVPSLPGYGFSAPLQRAGINLRAIGDIWVRLMRNGLGHSRFIAAGCDWGSLVSAEIGHAHPDVAMGVHMTLPILPGLDVRALGPDDYAADEQWMAARTAAARRVSAAHVIVQGSDPQTLAYALNDSPAGLAAWLWERRRNWSAPDTPMDADRLCTLASLYWLTGTVASSLRLYAEHRRAPWQPLPRAGKLIPVPTGVALAPHELFLLPRRIAERDTMLTRWTVLPRGGHFLPIEDPVALVDDYRAFARPLR